MSKTEATPAADRGSECNDLLGHAAEARWYCLDRDGVAMLCKDEADALAQVIENDDCWPGRAPHRAALLGEVSTQAAQTELERLRAENAELKRDLQYAREGLTKGRSRMREDNERLAREAHTWWTAARDATKAERDRCAIRVALHSQYPITTDFDRGYDKARKDAAETLRKMGDDAVLELGHNGSVEPL